MSNALPSAQQWEQGPKIVAIGGGTGLSTMLRGLKQYTKNLMLKKYYEYLNYKFQKSKTDYSFSEPYLLVAEKKS